MAYASYTDFKKDYERAVGMEKGMVSSTINKMVSGLIPPSRPPAFMGSENVPARTAWDLYRNSKNVALGFHIFGRHVSNEARWSREGGIDLASKQPGALGNLKHPTDASRSLSAMEYNFGIVNDSTDGSILMMGGQNWNLHVNDAWLLGGVHGHVPFHSASVLNKENLFRSNGGLGITGREFFGLLLAGYKKESGHESMGIAMVCKNKNLASDLDFPGSGWSVDACRVQGYGAALEL